MKESCYTDVDLSHNRIFLWNMKILRISKNKVFVFKGMVI